MPTLTKTKLQDILTRRLKLRNPTFILEKHGSRISGSLIDQKFHRMDDFDRQRKILNALDAELGSDSLRLVGIILAYSPLEWDLPLEGKLRRQPTRKAG